MKKLDLVKVAGEFEVISEDNWLFYNIETGEFDFYMDPTCFDVDDDWEKFEEDCWISCPSQQDLREYDIMTNFADTVTDLHKRELLSVALRGRGAFRRFKDTLHRIGIIDEWYDFKQNAFIEIAREWCEKNNIEYEGGIETQQSEPSVTEKKYPKNLIIIPLHKNMIDDVAKILHQELHYSKSNATAEVKRMLSSKRVAFAAITEKQAGSLCVVGVIGAIPHYGITGWELHPLAVLKEYQRQGIGRLLVESLEEEVLARGGVTLYLGSDDETGTTSLYGADLYDNTFEKVTNIQNIGNHPFPFYEKMGYRIVGVLPDVNGIGKPDIWMAKRI
jgi:aminoglycoside 6'-N-acetyltransferase I